MSVGMCSALIVLAGYLTVHGWRVLRTIERSSEPGGLAAFRACGVGSLSREGVEQRVSLMNSFWMLYETIVTVTIFGELLAIGLLWAAPDVGATALQVFTAMAVAFLLLFEVFAAAAFRKLGLIGWWPVL